MLPRQRLSEAHRGLKPYRQGDLDGLCGLYAIINAVRLCLYPTPLRPVHRRALLDIGIAELERQQLLAHALADGLYHPAWHRLCRAVVAGVSATTGIELAVCRPKPGTLVSTRHAITWIRWSIGRGRPVLLELHGRLRHWTVVVQVSEHRLIFFDSSGHRWIDLRGVELVRGRGQPRHRIYATGLAALRRVPPNTCSSSDSAMDTQSRAP